MLKQLLKKNLNVFSLAVMIKVETTVKEKFDVFSLEGTPSSASLPSA
jgi:hypothetical protein